MGRGVSLWGIFFRLVVLCCKVTEDKFGGDGKKKNFLI